MPAPVDCKPLYALTVSCVGSKKCGKFRAYRLEPMGVMPSPFIFCPFCGERAASQQDAQTDTMEIWSVEIGGDQPVPIELVKMMYAAWDYTTHGSFVEWAKKVVSGEIEL